MSKKNRIHPSAVILFSRGEFIHHTAVIDDCVKIGKNVRIDAGALIGFEGLLCRRNNKGEIIQRESTGGVIIEDNVRIGAGAMIQRGYHDNTIIGARSQIDINVHIGHDCKIGRDVFVAPTTVIAGVVTIGDFCYFGVGTVIRDNITIGKKVTVGMGAVVTRDIPDGWTVVGSPAMNIENFRKQRKVLKKISRLKCRELLWIKLKPFLGKIKRIFIK
jgi:UDP-3-O-[3-hydroxymyristoyl] glucosamine N-acyltransferase